MNPVEIARGGQFENGIIEHYPTWVADGKMPPFKGLENKISDPYVIRFNCLEVTTYCPLTKAPDYGRLVIEFMPLKLVVESKSLKEYLVQFRDKSIFQEEIVHQAMHDLWEFMTPKWLRIAGHFNNRGGIEETVIVERGNVL